MVDHIIVTSLMIFDRKIGQVAQDEDLRNHGGTSHHPQPPHTARMPGGKCRHRFFSLEVSMKKNHLVGRFNPPEKVYSTGMIIPNIWKNKQGAKPTTSHHSYASHVVAGGFNGRIPQNG